MTHLMATHHRWFMQAVLSTVHSESDLESTSTRSKGDLSEDGHFLQFGDTLAECPLRSARSAKKSRVHGGRDPHAGSRHRRKYGDLLGRQCCPPATASICRPSEPCNGVGDRFSGSPTESAQRGLSAGLPRLEPPKRHFFRHGRHCRRARESYRRRAAR